MTDVWLQQNYTFCWEMLSSVAPWRKIQELQTCRVQEFEKLPHSDCLAAGSGMPSPSNTVLKVMMTGMRFFIN